MRASKAKPSEVPRWRIQLCDRRDQQSKIWGRRSLAGMQLDAFTPMKDGPMTAELIAHVIGVKPDRLPLLLWSLVAAGLFVSNRRRVALLMTMAEFERRHCCRGIRLKDS